MTVEQLKKAKEIEHSIDMRKIRINEINEVIDDICCCKENSINMSYKIISAISYRSFKIILKENEIRLQEILQNIVTELKDELKELEKQFEEL